MAHTYLIGYYMAIPIAYFIVITKQTEIYVNEICQLTWTAMTLIKRNNMLSLTINTSVDNS